MLRQSTRLDNEVKKKYKQTFRQLIFDIRNKKYRTPAETQLLIQFTNQFEYFKQINYNKINVQNELQKRICQNIEFEAIKKGNFLFITGDEPDKFYIVLKGRSMILLDKSQEEINKMNTGTQINPLLVDMPNFIKDLRQPSTDTIRRMLILRFFQRIVLQIMNSLAFKKTTNIVMKKSLIDIKPQLKRKSLYLQMPQNIIKNCRRISLPFNNYVQNLGNLTIVSANFLFNQQIYEWVRKNFNILFKNLDLSEIRYQFRMFSGNIIKHNDIAHFYLPGHAFGELGFINNRARAASIFVIEDSVFGTLDKKSYQSSVMEIDKLRIQDNINYIKNIFFPQGSSISAEMLSKLQFQFKIKQFSLRSIIFEDSEELQDIHFIKEGEVELIQKVQTSIGIQNFRICQMGTNQCLDDEDYFTGKLERTFSAKVITDRCSIFVIKRENFTVLMKQNNKLLEFLIVQWNLKRDFRLTRKDKYLDMRFKYHIKNDDQQVFKKLEKKKRTKCDAISSNQQIIIKQLPRNIGLPSQIKNIQKSKSNQEFFQSENTKREHESHQQLIIMPSFEMKTSQKESFNKQLLFNDYKYFERPNTEVKNIDFNRSNKKEICVSLPPGQNQSLNTDYPNLRKLLIRFEQNLQHGDSKQINSKKNVQNGNFINSLKVQSQVYIKPQYQRNQQIQHLIIQQSKLIVLSPRKQNQKQLRLKDGVQDQVKKQQIELLNVKF